MQLPKPSKQLLVDRFSSSSSDIGGFGLRIINGHFYYGAAAMIELAVDDAIPEYCSSSRGLMVFEN